MITAFIRPLRLSAVAGVLGILFGLTVIFGQPASAHTQLLETTPANGALLQVIPTAVTMKFTQQPLSGSVAVVAQSASGTSVQLGTPTVSETTVTVPWPESAINGTYRVSWRVVSPDGHPVNGTWDFSYGVTSAQPFVEQPADQDVQGFPIWIAIVGILILAGVIVVLVKLTRKQA